MNEEEVLVGRIQDLAEQCYHRDVPSHTEFLTLAEQDLFYRTVNKIPGVRYVLSGGYESAERKAALFLPSYAEDGDASMLPIAVVRISPLNEKFADALSHRSAPVLSLFHQMPRSTHHTPNPYHTLRRSDR